MSLEHTLTATIQQLDANGNVMSRRVFAVDNTSPIAGQFLSGLLPTTAQTTIGLPTPLPLQLVFKNTHATAKITVVWTPTGGAEATVAVVGPGAVLAFFYPSTSATFGISSLKLTSDTINGTYELFIGG